KRISITIEDEGEGIPPEDLPHIFDRFYRVDKARTRSTGGTGLGLSIVKEIVELHDGNITVTSEVDYGSCFIISLPSIKKHDYHQ
ncbi:sensor histidine kinase, partial [Bacillus cereus]|nr:sensor histidine kinase [Bacillus cereus]